MKVSTNNKLSRNELKQILGGNDPVLQLCPICSCDYPYTPAYLSYAAANFCEPNPCVISEDPRDPNPCSPIDTP